MKLGDVVKVFYNDRVDMFGSPRSEWYYGEVVKIRPIPGGSREDITVNFGPSYRQTIGCPCRELVKVDIPIDSDAFFPERFSPGDIVDVLSFHAGKDAEELYRGRVAAADHARGTCDVYYYDGFGYEKNIPTDQRKVRLISPLSEDRSWLDGKEVLVKSPENAHYAATIALVEESRGDPGRSVSCRIMPKYAAEGKEAFMSDVQAAEAALSLQMKRSLDERRIRVCMWPVSGTACPAETARKRRRDAVNYNEDEGYSSTAGSDDGDSLSQRRKTCATGDLSFQSGDDSSEEEDIEAYNDRIAGSGGRSDCGSDSSPTDDHEALTGAEMQRSSKVEKEVITSMRCGDQSQQSYRGAAERSDADGSDGLSSTKAASSAAAAAGQKDYPEDRTNPCLPETAEQRKPLLSAGTLTLTEAFIIPNNSREATIPNSTRLNMLRKLCQMQIRTLTNLPLPKDVLAIVRILELHLYNEASSLSVYTDISTLKRRIASVAQRTSVSYANCRTNRSSALEFAERVLAAFAEGGIDATPIHPARDQPQTSPQPKISANAAVFPSGQYQKMNHAEMDPFQRQQRNGQKDPASSMPQPRDNHPRTHLAHQTRQAVDNAYRATMLKAILSLFKDHAESEAVKESWAKLLEKELYLTAESIESYCDNSTLFRRIREATPRVNEKLHAKETSRQTTSFVDRGSTRANAVQHSQPIQEDSVGRRSGDAASQPSTSHGATDTESESQKCLKPKLSVGCAAKKALALNESSDSDSSSDEEEIQLKEVSHDFPENTRSKETDDGPQYKSDSRQSSQGSPRADKSIGKKYQEPPKNDGSTSQDIRDPRRYHRGGKGLDQMSSDNYLLEQAISTLEQEKKNLQDMLQSKDDEIKELRRQMAKRSDPKDLVRSAIAANKQSHNAALASKDLEIDYLKSDLRRAQERAKEMNRVELMQVQVIAELKEQHQAERTRVDEEHAGKLNALRESYEAKYLALQAQMDLIRGFQQKSI